MSRRAESIALHATLIAGALITLFPLFWMISASVMATGEATTLPPHIVPHAPTLAQYRELFVRLNIGRAFLSSAIIAVVVTLGSVLTSSMAGYAFAKLRFGGRQRIFGLLLLAVVIPPQVGMLPLFLLMKKLHLVNTYWGAIIPSLATVFGIFLIRQFMLAVPQDLLEAARIDGAGGWRQFRHVTLPMLGPTFLFVGVVVAIGQLQIFAEPYVMTRGGPLNKTLTMVMLMYEQGFKFWRMGYAAAVAFVLFLIIGAATVVQMRLQEKR